MNSFSKFLICLISFSTINATNIEGELIKLPDHFKVSNTFSGELTETNSFHLIFSKNKKTKEHTVHSYTYNGKELNHLGVFKNKYSYNLVSFHKEGDILSILLSFEKKYVPFIQVVHINTSTKEIKKETPVNHKDFSSVVREENKSICLYKNKDGIIIKQYKGANTPTEMEYKFISRKDPYKVFFDAPITFVKTNEFVANGAISEFRMYVDNDKLIFTKENIRKSSTSVVSLPLDSDSFSLSEIKTFSNQNNEKAYKKSTSFYHDNNLYQFSNDKNNGSIKINSISSEENNTILLSNLDKEAYTSGTNFIGLENFFKQATKSKFSTTITANPTIDQKIKVRVDYVEKVKYSYYNDWWWHHQQFMMWQNQNMIQNIKISTPSGFGPAQPDDVYFNTYPTIKEKGYFEITLNSNGKVEANSKSTTKHKEIDKEYYINKLEDDKDLEHTSSCFLPFNVRYMSYSKKQKGFIIQTNKLR